MGTPNRLSLDTPTRHPLITSEQAHRVQLAERLCDGLRVAQLDCRDPAAVRGLLERDLRDEFDVVVCLEGIEELPDREGVFDRLARHAADGIGLLVALPNEGDFGLEGSMAARPPFAESTVLYQFAAEGSLIRGEEREDVRGQFVLGEHGEIESASCFICCVNLDERLRGLGDWAEMQLAVAPQYSRAVRDLERANRELRRENARLAHARIGTAGPAPDPTERVRQLEARIAELEGSLAAPRHAAIERMRARVRERPALDRVARWIGRRLS